MKIELTHNLDDVGRFVQHVFSDQLPFVEAVAINDTAKQGQGVQRRHQEDVFELRRKSFFDRGVKITQWATKQRAEARIAVDPPGGEKRRSVITRHEADQYRDPYDGGTLAVPTDNVPRNASGVIARAWRPKQLLRDGVEMGRSGRVSRGQVTRFGVKRGGVTHRGRRAAFLIRKPGGGGTIFERDGPDLVPLYHLVPFVPLDQRLQFVENISRTVVESYSANFVRRFDEAIGIRGRSR